eukprot:4690591-Alexandrium_andersonii.AAC.1
MGAPSADIQPADLPVRLKDATAMVAKGALSAREGLLVAVNFHPQDRGAATGSSTKDAFGDSSAVSSVESVAPEANVASEETS